MPIIIDPPSGLPVPRRTDRKPRRRREQVPIGGPGDVEKAEGEPEKTREPLETAQKKVDEFTAEMARFVEERARIDREDPPIKGDIILPHPGSGCKMTSLLKNVEGRYGMIKSADIKNFRGFAKTKVTDLRRINIVVGDNGAGKTAFLEALFAAAAASPEIVLNLRKWRGMPSSARGMGQRAIHEALWGDLFHGFDFQNEVSVALKGVKKHTRSIRIFMSGEPTVIPITDESSQSIIPTAPITFEWRHPFSKGPIQSTPRLTPEGLAVNPTPDSHIAGRYYAARMPFSSSENATLFSQLSTNNKETEFINAMKNQFGDIETISVELEYGTPMLFVKFSWAKRRLPINILSDGMNKIAAVLLGIADRTGGVVFVDELDTGVYFKRHEAFWSQINHFSKMYGTQVFGSTHSLEFLMAALPAMRTHPQDFSLVRVYRKNGMSKASIVGGTKALSLIESGFEVRS